jgi:hypothetical protein
MTSEIVGEGKRVIASMTEESEGLKEYADPSICSYVSYLCSYCGQSFLLVDPDDDFNAGGALCKEVIKNDNGSFNRFGKVRGTCLSCAREIMTRNRTRYFSW